MIKEFLRRIMNFIPNKISLLLLGIVFELKEHKKIKNSLNELVEYEDGNEEDLGFYRNLRIYSIYNSHVGAFAYLESYFKGEELRKLKVTGEIITAKDVVLVCCVKDDIDRIKVLVPYHKKLGIRKMVFVDNDSTDGTREWLLQQEVDVYGISEKYHSGRKAAWIRKVQNIYGYDRWYLVVDSDELYTYIGAEEHSINELIQYAESKNVKRVRSLMLDMYSNHELYKLYPGTDYFKDYRFFDNSTYYSAKDGRGYMMRGGPRFRVFGGGKSFSEPQVKYPLFYAQREDIWEDHRPLPYQKNFNSLFLGVLRHYKFLPGDWEKYKSIAKNENYYNDSSNYKKYLSAGNVISFYYEKSCEYVDSYSLKSLDFLDEAEWL